MILKCDICGIIFVDVSFGDSRLKQHSDTHSIPEILVVNPKCYRDGVKYLWIEGKRRDLVYTNIKKILHGRK